MIVFVCIRNSDGEARPEKGGGDQYGTFDESGLWNHPAQSDRRLGSQRMRQSVPQSQPILQFAYRG